MTSVVIYSALLLLIAAGTLYYFYRVDRQKKKSSEKLDDSTPSADLLMEDEDETDFPAPTLRSEISGSTHLGLNHRGLRLYQGGGGSGGQVTISLPQAPSTTNQDAGETLVFTVKDLAEVAFADSQVSVIVVGQDYAIILTDQFLRLNGVTQGVAFSRRLTAGISLQDPSAAAVAATLLSQTDNSFTFELAWVALSITGSGGTIAWANYINGNTPTINIKDPDGNLLPVTQTDATNLEVGAYVPLAVTIGADDITPTVGELVTVTITATGADSFCVWFGNNQSDAGPNTAANERVATYTYYLPGIYTLQGGAWISASGVGGGVLPADEVDITVAGILDTYATSAFIGTAAILLQRLYANNCLEVRRNGGSPGTSNFAFTDAVYDEFQTYVGANDGFVRTLYNQVGNDWVQTNNALQPQVIDAGTLQTNPFGGWVMKFSDAQYMTATREDFWPVGDRTKLFLAFAFSCDGGAASATNHILGQWEQTAGNQRSFRAFYVDSSEELGMAYSPAGLGGASQQIIQFSGISLNEFAIVLLQMDTTEAVNDRIKAWKVGSGGLTALTRVSNSGDFTGNIHNSTGNFTLGTIDSASTSPLSGTISPFIIATPQLLSTADRNAVGEYMYNRISNGF